MEGTAIKTRVVYKRLKIAITEATKSILGSLVFDKNILKVTGIAISTDNEDALQTLTQRVEMNGKEIFEQDHEAKMIYCYPTVEGDKRYYNLDEQMQGNSQVKINAYDTKASDFTPYNVIFYLRCLQADN